MKPPIASSLLESLLKNPLSPLSSFSAIIRSRSQAQQLHAHLLKSKSSTSLSSIISVYSSLGLVHEAHLAFSSLPSPSPLSYKTIIRCSASLGLYDQALSLFNRMRASGLVPARNFFPSVLKSCAVLRRQNLGESLHGSVIKLGLDSDLYTGNALINMYAKLGHPRNEHNPFAEFPESEPVDQNAPKFGFLEGPSELDSSLVRMSKVFDGMPQRDVVSWNTMIAGNAVNGLYEEALSMVSEMGSVGLKPDSFTLSTVLPIFAEFVDLAKGMEVHGYAIRNGLDSDVFMGSSLVDMYANYA